MLSHTGMVFRYTVGIVWYTHIVSKRLTKINTSSLYVEVATGLLLLYVGLSRAVFVTKITAFIENGALT